MADELTPEEVSAELFGPHTIHDPEGRTFVVQVHFDPSTMDQVFDQGLMRYEVRGPDDHGHLWMADWQGEFLVNPADDDIPPLWTIRAKVAL